MADSRTPADLIANLEAAFAAHGYFVAAEALPGEEAQWAATLAEAFAKLESDLAFICQRYNCRGRSKRALAILHGQLPSPTWGVELIA